MFFFYSYLAPPHLPSSPTRRSSDLRRRRHLLHLFERHARERARLAAERAAVERRLHRRLRLARRGRRENVRVVDRKSTRLNSSHITISYAVFCLKKKKINNKI